MKSLKTPRFVRTVSGTVSTDVVIQIHEYLEKKFADSEDPIFPPGIKDRNLLESAVMRQNTSYGGIHKYPDVFDNVASLIFGLTNDHPFHNGNKRTALLAGLLHLDRNGWVIHDAKWSDLYGLMLSVANHAMAEPKKGELTSSADDEVRAIATWLRTRARKISRGERVITYRELWRILGKYGYQLGAKKGNHVEIMREYDGWFRLGKGWKTVYKAPCPGDGAEVQLEQLKKIRIALQLDERNGVDSEDFYDNQSRIDSLINEHRTVLRELAKV